jgi:HlyD family secretion protein
MSSPSESGAPSVSATERPRTRRSPWAALVLIAAVAGGIWLFVSRPGKPAAAQPASVTAAASNATPAGVGCVGHVEPEGGIIAVAAAPTFGRTSIVAKLLVKEGQLVAPGDAIAILQSLPDLEGAVKQADARVAVAQSRLAQLQAGARPGDVLALQSDLARLETEANAARQELEREEALARKDFVPRVRVDAARLKSEEAQRQLEAARHRLESLTEVRDSDLNLAKAELAAAEADREQASVEQSAGTVRSPAKGRVIEILARPGEAIGLAGVVTIADTSRMNVVAEVYETDIARVHLGQRASIRSEALSQPIDGVVGWISPQIEDLNLPVDPAAPAGQRVYKARIAVSQPELLAGRIHSKVNVIIEP